MNLVEVFCPSCFEAFGVAAPGVEELPAQVDYDCEVCCRPMVIDFHEEAGEVFAEARGLED